MDTERDPALPPGLALASAHLLQPLQAPSQLAELPPQAALLLCSLLRFPDYGNSAAEKVTPAPRCRLGPRPPGPGLHSPATLSTLALVGRPGGPSVHVSPSGPSTWPRGQLQVKLPAVLRQRCEHRETPALHSSKSDHRKEEDRGR